MHSHILACLLSSCILSLRHFLSSSNTSHLLTYTLVSPESSCSPFLIISSCLSIISVSGTAVLLCHHDVPQSSIPFLCQKYNFTMMIKLSWSPRCNLTTWSIPSVIYCVSTKEAGSAWARIYGTLLWVTAPLIASTRMALISMNRLQQKQLNLFNIVVQTISKNRWHHKFSAMSHRCGQQTEDDITGW